MFVTRIDLSHFKNSQLEQTLTKLNGRYVLRADALFTEQGFRSASRMTTAEGQDVIARPLGCAGQASGRSIRPYPSPNGGRSATAETSQVWMSRYMDTSTTPKEGQSLEESVVLLGKNFYGHPLLDCGGRDSSSRFHMKMDGRKNPPWNACFVHRQQCLFLSVNVDYINISGKHNLDPMWKGSKHVDLEKPYDASWSSALGMHSTRM